MIGTERNLLVINEAEGAFAERVPAALAELGLMYTLGTPDTLALPNNHEAYAYMNREVLPRSVDAVVGFVGSQGFELAQHAALAARAQVPVVMLAPEDVVLQGWLAALKKGHIQPRMRLLRQGGDHPLTDALDITDALFTASVQPARKMWRALILQESEIIGVPEGEQPDVAKKLELVAVNG